MALKPGPKRIAKSTGEPDRRARDNKDTPRNTPSLKPPKQEKINLKRSLSSYEIERALLVRASPT